jgi:thiamine-phosphate pyrophosphorylase
MKLFVISPSKNVDDEPMIVVKMFESGLPVFHLRKPKFSTQQMREYLNEIPVHFHNRIVIHSHHKLALKYNLRGIHLTGTHLKKRWRYWLLRQRLRLKFVSLTKSRSYTKLQQAYTSEQHHFDYYLIGTVFNSLTGGLYSGFYDEGLRAAIKNTAKKFVARGGTKPEIIKKASEYGFYGIAFNSYLWDSENPYKSFLEILAVYREANIAFD